MRYFAHFLADIACVFMPFGGIYLMSTVVYSTLFMIESPESREAFIKDFYESRGSGMATYLKKVPLYVVRPKEGTNLAYRGCVRYAL
jgi:glucokinase